MSETRKASLSKTNSVITDVGPNNLSSSPNDGNLFEQKDYSFLVADEQKKSDSVTIPPSTSTWNYEEKKEDLDFVEDEEATQEDKELELIKNLPTVTLLVYGPGYFCPVGHISLWINNKAVYSFGPKGLERKEDNNPVENWDWKKCFKHSTPQKVILPVTKELHAIFKNKHNEDNEQKGISWNIDYKYNLSNNCARFVESNLIQWGYITKKQDHLLFPVQLDVTVKHNVNAMIDATIDYILDEEKINNMIDYVRNTIDDEKFNDHPYQKLKIDLLKISNKEEEHPYEHAKKIIKLLLKLRSTETDEKTLAAIDLMYQKALSKLGITFFESNIKDSFNDVDIPRSKLIVPVAIRIISQIPKVLGLMIGSVIAASLTIAAIVPTMLGGMLSFLATPFVLMWRKYKAPKNNQPPKTSKFSTAQKILIGIGIGILLVGIGIATGGLAYAALAGGGAVAGIGAAFAWVCSYLGISSLGLFGGAGVFAAVGSWLGLSMYSTRELLTDKNLTVPAEKEQDHQPPQRRPSSTATIIPGIAPISTKNNNEIKQSESNEDNEEGYDVNPKPIEKPSFFKQYFSCCFGEKDLTNANEVNNSTFSTGSAELEEDTYFTNPDAELGEKGADENDRSSRHDL